MKTIKNIVFLVINFTSLIYYSQASDNMIYKSEWKSNDFGINFYNEVFGYNHNGREYAILGSNWGTHILDVTNPTNPIILANHQGAPGVYAIHRDYDIYHGYLYAVCDEGNSKLQIFNLNHLPDSAPMVYESNQILIRSHNIFIDSNSARLYSAGGISASGTDNLLVIDISNPIQPTLVLDCFTGISWFENEVGYCHDLYAYNDTIITNDADGAHIIDFTNINNVTLLATIDNYTDIGYNHSGYVDKTRKKFVMNDETKGSDTKFFDISNSNIPIEKSTFTPYTYSLAHNPLIKNDLVYISYYIDGVYVLDIKNLDSVKVVAFYDSYPADIGSDPNADASNGCWGVFPFLNSGNILISDMSRGLIVLKIDKVTNVNENESPSKNINIYPNVCSIGTKIKIETEHKINYQIFNSEGKLLINNIDNIINTSGMLPGVYTIVSESGNAKFVIN